MNQKVMHLQNLYDFSLVRYEPNSIILLDKRSRKAYDFYQLSSINNLKPDVCHPYLLRPVLYKNGAMYPRGCYDLSSLLQARRRDYNPQKYSVQELSNTFEPVLECVEYLHQKGISFGNLSAEHIVFFQSGDICLKDWLFRRPQNDNSQFDRNKDMKQIGIMLASVALLTPESQVQKLSSSEIVQKILQHYSINLCSAIIILIEGVAKHYNCVLSLLRNQNDQPKIPQVKPIIDKSLQIKNMKERQKNKSAQQQKAKDKLLKQVQNEKHKAQTPRKQQLKSQNVSLQGSPTKKFNISTPNKKIIRLEDCQNKRVFNEEVKKRQIQKITKIIERSNAFVNELMARKNNDKKNLATIKLNSSLMETQQNSKRAIIIKQSPKISSPSKRLRSISKKK